LKRWRQKTNNREDWAEKKEKGGKAMDRDKVEGLLLEIVRHVAVSFELRMPLSEQAVR
jgi:hypothetical protein